MSESDPPQVAVMRKLAARASGGGQSKHPNAAQRLALALCRALQEVAGLDIRVAGQSQVSCALDKVEQDARGYDHGLIVLVEAPGGSAGLVVVSAPFLSTIVAQRMTGRPPDTLPAARCPTRTDSEMLRDVIDGFIAIAGQSVGWIAGYKVCGMIPDARLARFALSEGEYQAIRMDVALPGALGEAEMLLALPQPEQSQQGSGTSRAWGQDIQAIVMASDMPVEAVLVRMKLPFSQVSNLQPGDVVPLARSAIDGVRIEAAGRALVATGRLGQSNGNRAVRVLSAVAVPDAQAPQPVQSLAPAAGSSQMESGQDELPATLQA